MVDYARYIDVPGAPVSEDDDAEEFAPTETDLAIHHELILRATERCINRHRGRTMLFLPPGSAKSTYATVVAPTHAMGRIPGFKVIVASYATDLARKFGKRMRSIVKQPGYRALFATGLSAESGAADEWALENGSEFMGGGIMSGMTGNRADFIAIDDPVKGRQEADSDATQKSTIDAYQDDILTRLKPSGSLMITMTRWQTVDLAGHILPEGWAGESGMIECRDGETWEVICVPAKCTSRNDPLGRAIGEYIWPEWFGREHWAAFERIPRTWSALYQQVPAPDTGDYFKREWIIPIAAELIPPRETMMIYGGSDYAVTADGGDYTVHAVVGVASDGRMYLLDLWRAQASSDVWVDAFCNLVRKWKPIGWAEETGQIKSGVGPFLLKRMMDTESYVAREQFPTRGDKAVRAQSIRGRMAMQGLYVPRDAAWLSDFISELMSFPVGVHDDQCLVEGTLVDMADGSRKPIEKVMPGDCVSTHMGPCEVIASKVTNDNASVIDVELSNGSKLVCTPNHPVFVVGKGFVRADALGINDQVCWSGESLCSADQARARLSNIEGTDTDGILTAATGRTASIFMGQNPVAAFCIDMYGKMRMALSPMVAKFITEMRTRSTTMLAISLASPTRSIGRSILSRTRIANWPTSPASALWPLLGIPARKGLSGTAPTGSGHGKPENHSSGHVHHAETYTSLGSTGAAFVRVAASREALAVASQREVAVPILLRLRRAFAAACSSLQLTRKAQNTAPRHAVCVTGKRELLGRARVHNLAVSNAHTFYANGVLTHNCDAIGLVGQLMDRMSNGNAPKDERPRTPRGAIAPPPIPAGKRR